METLQVLDVQEHEVTSAQPPSFPKPSSSASGFPEHKKRTRVSAFKQRRHGEEAAEPKPATFKTQSTAHAAAGTSQDLPSSTPSQGFEDDEKRRIDQENNERLATMTPQEIEEARQELFNGLSDSALATLLRRANLDEKTGPSPFDEEPQRSPREPPPEIQIEDAAAVPPTTSKTKKKVTFEEPDSTEPAAPTPPTQPPTDEPQEDIPSHPDEDAPAEPPSEYILPSDAPATRPHWPHPPATPDLDPADPNFLANLHQKYFPNLPADPTKLAWMAPIPTPNSPADRDSPYYPSQGSLPISALRFDFRGTLLPPRIARAIPVSKGLHHHGEAPEAAGYTVAELAKLARSAVPGQRCIAYQTLGRVLFRLGKGEFGRPGDAVADGIWAAMMEGGVMESLYEEAGMEMGVETNDVVGNGVGRGHHSAYAFAVEAIWLFSKGGWKERVRRGK